MYINKKGEKEIIGFDRRKMWVQERRIFREFGALGGRIKVEELNIIRNIKTCAIHRNTRVTYVVHLIHPGRPFLHPQRSRPASMKIQPGTFSSIHLVYSTKPTYPAYTPHTKQRNISTPANAGFFFAAFVAFSKSIP